MNTLGIEQAARELHRNSPGGETDERWEGLPADERDWYRERVRDVLRVYGEFAAPNVDERDPDGRCGRLLVGQATDTWDPTCIRPRGHAGFCTGEKS